MFAVPYFVYDIYAMFMCYWYKLQVKGHEEASAAPQHMSSALTSYLHREFLMVLHHVVMVTVCFPVSVVTVTHCSFCQAEILVRQGENIALNYPYATSHSCRLKLQRCLPRLCSTEGS